MTMVQIKLCIWLNISSSLLLTRRQALNGHVLEQPVIQQACAQAPGHSQLSTDRLLACKQRDELRAAVLRILYSQQCAWWYELRTQAEFTSSPACARYFICALFLTSSAQPPASLSTKGNWGLEGKWLIQSSITSKWLKEGLYCHLCCHTDCQAQGFSTLKKKKCRSLNWTRVPGSKLHGDNKAVWITNKD